MADAAHLVHSTTDDLRSVQYERSLYVEYKRANADLTLIVSMSQNTERSGLICDPVGFLIYKSSGIRNVTIGVLRLWRQSVQALPALLDSSTKALSTASCMKDNGLIVHLARSGTGWCNSSIIKCYHS